MDHLAEQSVLDLVAGALVEPAATAAHAHLDRCDECRALVAGVIGVIALDPRARGTPVVTDDDHVHATLPEAPFARRTPRPLAARPLPVERIDEYRVLELLGSGGMGAVYRAHDTLLDREVAIKLIAPTSSAAARQRFLLEARAVARIRHPNVVVVHRVVAAEQPYIVYELVRGHTFGQLLTPIPWPKVLELAAGVLRGLAAAHACSVLHRDLKPANLMLNDHGDVVLVDFGLAKLDADGGPGLPATAGGDSQITSPGVALGTPRYMAPEAWRGAPATAQTDLYSLGVVLFEMLAGRPPFGDAPIDELARRVCETDAPSIAEHAPWVPAMFGELIDRCLAREPAHRPGAAATLGEELETLQRGLAFDAFERERVRRAPQGNPYPGARPFGFEHQGVFFGRRDELRALVKQLRARPFVIVAGESGAGKTSLCMAGLLPLVMKGALGGARKWVPVPIVLGDRPLAALAEALAPHVELPRAAIEPLLATDPAAVIGPFRAGHRGGCTAHVVFVDQLEQLAAHPDREAVAQLATILGMLAQPGAAIRVLATLRISSLIAVAQLPGLAPVIGSALYLLLEPRDEAALREIVVEPAKLGGGAVDEPTAAALISSAARGELGLGALAARLASWWDARSAAG